MTNEIRAVIAWIVVALLLTIYACEEKTLKKFLGYFLASNMFMVGLCGAVYLVFYIIKTTWRMI